MKIVLDTSWPERRWAQELARVARASRDLRRLGVDPWHPLTYPLEAEATQERVERLEAERATSEGRLVPWRRRRR